MSNETVNKVVYCNYELYRCNKSTNEYLIGVYDGGMIEVTKEQFIERVKKDKWMIDSPSKRTRKEYKELIEYLDIKL